jgi:TatD DNase family protein
MIDSHCHLTDSAFDEDREQVLERAKEAGITHCIVVADSIESAEKGITLTKRFPEMLSASIGIHPHKASEWNEKSDMKLREFASDKSVVAIGEIGLDYHYEFSPRDIQRRAFEEQLHIAKELNLPAILHTREAYEGTLAIVKKVRPQKLVWHCCTEKWENVEPFLAMSSMLSFGGIATYPNAADMRETIRRCPMDRMMLETDAPYLAPIPYRGKRNEPAYVMEVAKCIATVKGLSLEEVEQVTTENAVRFFDLAAV